MMQSESSFSLQGARVGRPYFETPCVEVHRVQSANGVERWWELVIKDEGCDAMHPDDETCPDHATAEDIVGPDVEQIGREVIDPTTGHLTFFYLDMRTVHVAA